MTDTIIHVGDVGTIIRLTITEDDGTTAVDVSSATTKTFYFEKGDRSRVSKTAEFNTDGSDGKLKYTTVAGDVDKTGTWQVQAYVEIGTAKYFSNKARFYVENTLV